MKRMPWVIAMALLPSINPLLLSGAAADCTVSSSSVNFGSFNPLTGSYLDSTGNITVNCTGDVASYSIALSTGGGSYSPRSMVDGAYHLDYNLYHEASYQEVWGDGTSGTYTVTNLVPVGGLDNLHPVYGRIPLSSQRSAHIGVYSDSISVTVTY